MLALLNSWSTQTFSDNPAAIGGAPTNRQGNHETLNNRDEHMQHHN